MKSALRNQLSLLRRNAFYCIYELFSQKRNAGVKDVTYGRIAFDNLKKRLKTEENENRKVH